MFLWCKGEYKIASIHYKLRDVNKSHYKQKIEKQGGVVSSSESEKYLDEILLAMSLEENKFGCADMVENKLCTERICKSSHEKALAISQSSSDFWLFYEWDLWVGDVGDDANRIV